MNLKYESTVFFPQTVVDIPKQSMMGLTSLLFGKINHVSLLLVYTVKRLCIIRNYK